MDSEPDIFGLSTDDIIFNFKKLDLILKLEQLDLKICLIGGAACLLLGMIHRATVDYDLLNLEYHPKTRNYLNFFQPYDLVDFEATTIPRSYTGRLVNVFSGDFLQ